MIKELLVIVSLMVSLGVTSCFSPPQKTSPVASPQPEQVPRETSPAPTPGSHPGTPKTAIVPSGTPALFSQTDATQAAMSSILEDQKATWLLNGGQFTSDLSSLPSQPGSQTALYHFEIVQADQQIAIATATAKQANLPSYTGVVFAIEASLPILGLCQTNQPSLTPPAPPQLTGTQIECALGSSLVDQG
jgi:hypothetical protein